MSKQIAIDYLQMETLARRFEQLQAQDEALLKRLASETERLKDSWMSDAALRWYGEMENDVLPALGRLAKSMGQASSVSRQIIKLFQQAEDIAGGFISVGTGSGTGGAGNSSLGTGSVLGDLQAYNEFLDQFSGQFGAPNDPGVRLDDALGTNNPSATPNPVGGAPAGGAGIGAGGSANPIAAGVAGVGAVGAVGGAIAGGFGTGALGVGRGAGGAGGGRGIRSGNVSNNVPRDLFSRIPLRPLTMTSILDALGQFRGALDKFAQDAQTFLTGAGLLANLQNIGGDELRDMLVRMTMNNPNVPMPVQALIAAQIQLLGGSGGAVEALSSFSPLLGNLGGAPLVGGIGTGDALLGDLPTGLQSALVGQARDVQAHLASMNASFGESSIKAHEQMDVFINKLS